jgi:hypothetical protein
MKKTGESEHDDGGDLEPTHTPVHGREQDGGGQHRHLSRTTIFTSSTRDTEHSLHGFGARCSLPFGATSSLKTTATRPSYRNQYLVPANKSILLISYRNHFKCV